MSANVAGKSLRDGKVDATSDNTQYFDLNSGQDNVPNTSRCQFPEATSVILGSKDAERKFMEIDKRFERKTDGTYGDYHRKYVSDHEDHEDHEDEVNIIKRKIAVLNNDDACSNISVISPIIRRSSSLSSKQTKRVSINVEQLPKSISETKIFSSSSSDDDKRKKAAHSGDSGELYPVYKPTSTYLRSEYSEDIDVGTPTKKCACCWPLRKDTATVEVYRARRNSALRRNSLPIKRTPPDSMDKESDDFSKSLREYQMAVTQDSLKKAKTDESLYEIVLDAVRVISNPRFSIVPPAEAIPKEPEEAVKAEVAVTAADDLPPPTENEIKAMLAKLNITLEPNSLVETPVSQIPRVSEGNVSGSGSGVSSRSHLGTKSILHGKQSTTRTKQSIGFFDRKKTENDIFKDFNVEYVSSSDDSGSSIINLMNTVAKKTPNN